jgi:drug/metabolite transporter (DMT)-like permease
MRLDIPWHKSAIKTYLFSGLGIAVSMMFVYWAAQYIPSGWISLIFGLSPIITGMLVFAVHGENEFSKDKLFGLFLGLAGLAVIFSTGFTLSAMAALGIIAVLVSTVIYSFTAIKIKQHNQDIPALTVTAAGLLFAIPFYSLCWYLMDGGIPEVVEPRAGLSIGKYLNDEPLTLEILTGAMMILAGLASYEFGNLLKYRRGKSL